MFPRWSYFHRRRTMPKQSSDPAGVSVATQAVVRRFLLAFLSAALVFSSLVGAIYRQDVLHQRALLEQESQHVADLQQELLSLEFDAVQSDLLYLATQHALVRLLSGEVAARGILQREYVRFALNKGMYDQIRILDNGGQETVRVNYRDGDARAVPPGALQNKSTRYYFLQAQSLERGEVFVSPFDLNVEHGQIQRPIKPVIRFATPVFDQTGQRRGLLVLNYLGAHLLSKLRQVSAGFRGESMLVNAAGEYIQAADSGDEWGWLLGHQRSFRADFPSAWDRGKRGDAEWLRLGQDLFTFRHVAPGHRTAAVTGSLRQYASAQHAANRPEPALDDPLRSALIVVSYVSSAVANEHSKALLAQLILMDVGVMAVVAVLALYWARSGIIRRSHELHIAESEARLRQLSSSLLAAQEAERRNLSRHLHDDIGQQVTAIRLDLQLLERKADRSDERLTLQRAIDQTDQLLKNLHEIAARVRPSVLDDLGLRDAVESFLSEFGQRTGIAVVAHLTFGRESIPATVGENVYRIAQEALANVAAHAQVEEVEVTIVTEAEALRMTVCDRGIGFEPAAQSESSRLGILGMRERIDLLHGEFDLQSAPGQGTRVRVVIPLDRDGQ